LTITPCHSQHLHLLGTHPQVGQIKSTGTLLNFQ
jgi:hypothetical protein